MHRTPSENEPSPKKIDWTFSLHSGQIRSLQCSIIIKTKQQENDSENLEETQDEDSQSGEEDDFFGEVFDEDKQTAQGELELDGGPKGKFEGESPNVLEGEDLDIPPFLRNKKK